MKGSGELVTRRTQFSSCDECRRSRVACDAATKAKREDGVDPEDSSVSCSRCAHRGKECTFKWVKENKGAATKKASTSKKKGRRRKASPSVASETAVEQRSESHEVLPPLAIPYRSPNASDWSSPFVPINREHGSKASFSFHLTPDAVGSPSARGLGALSSGVLSQVEAQWLSTVYRMGFDTVFGSWMGRFSCPFGYGENSRGDRYVHADELCTQLDRWMADDTMNDQQDFRMNQAAAHEESERNRQIEESLRSTIAAFAARWLPLAPSSVKGEGDKINVIQDLWRHARRDMLRVINRPSYRSMLTLFLFGLTPIPVGITEDEELDGISGQVCIHAGLQHIQILRARQRNLQFSGAKVSPYLKKQAIPTSPDSLGTSDFMHSESTAYWAALTFDTSASLTLNCRSLLSSGLFGHNEELSWRLVRTCGKMFDEIAQQWQPGSLDMTDDRANQIVGAGAAWKLLGWKLTAVFKEALRDGHEEGRVQAAYRGVVESIQYFNATFRPHLEACQRRMQFLGQQTKLRWYSLMLHYHLSILMFFDIIEATERYDLMADVREINIEAENTVMNTLVFGLHNTYTVSMKPTASIGEDSGPQTVTVPLTSIDPYPHHIVAGVQLVRKAIERDFSLGKIAEESHASLQSTLERTLSLLPQCSKSVQAAKTKLSEKIPDSAGGYHQDPYRILHAHFAD